MKSPILEPIDYSKPVEPITTADNVTVGYRNMKSQPIEKKIKGEVKYEFTRKEIIEWLHEQNWKCEQLEKLLIQPKK